MSLGAGDFEHLLLRVPVLLQTAQVAGGGPVHYADRWPFIRLGGYQVGRLTADQSQLLRFFQLQQNLALDWQ